LAEGDVGADHRRAEGWANGAIKCGLIVSDSSRTTLVGTAPFLTSAGARALLDAALAEAARIGVPQCAAVVDAGGFLLAFGRSDGARLASVAIAQTKAVSAATRRRPTAEEAGGDALTQIRLSLAGKSITGIGGGLPIVVDGQVVGGIGVSSGTVDEDLQCARAGLAALDA
jgi:glc operon protein GlcG